MNTRIWMGYADKTCKQPLWYSGDNHGVLCMKTRGGKGSCYLTQIGLTYEGSIFCNDPKGQWLSVVGRYRRDVMGQKIYVLNPYGILPDYLGGFFHATYDPVASLLDPDSESFASDADNLFEGLMPQGGPDPHWVNSGRQLGSGVTMLLRRYMDLYSLPDVYTTLCDGNLHKFIRDEIEHLSAEREDLVDETVEHIIQRLSRFGGTVAEESKEISGIVSSAITALGWLSNKAMSRNTKGSTIDFRRMKYEPMTVVLISPGRNLRICNPWVRTITNAWADAMLQEGGGDVPNLGVLDEFPTSVGNLSSVNTLSAMGAGYGVQLITVCQNLNQLVELMPHGWQTWLGNTGWQIYGPPGAGDMFTANHISQMTGQTEVPTVSRSLNEGANQPLQLGNMVTVLNDAIRAGFGNNGVNVTLGSRQRPYLLPEEIRELGGDEALVWAEGVKGVIRSGRRPYYKDPLFAGKYDEDPYHAKKSARSSATQ